MLLIKKIVKVVAVLALCFTGLYAASALGAEGLSGLSDRVGEGFKSIGKIMMATAYVSGFGLTIAAIFKFKQHKDNPQQVPMGTPITMLLVGIALIFLPNFIKPAGESIFGKDVQGGGFAGEGVEIIPGAGGGSSGSP